MLKNKVDTALAFIQEQLAGSNSPALCYSGGHDSQTLLYLVRQVLPEISVAYFDLADDARKNAFVHEMANVWDLRLHVLAPLARDLVANEAGHTEVVHFYRVGDWIFHLGMQGRKEMGNAPICAIEQHLGPVSPEYLAADLIFHGHKSSDSDTMYGAAPLTTDVLGSASGQTRLVYPLKDWTDADVWAVTEYLNIPQNWRRYDKRTKQKLASDVFNADYYNLCTRCVAPGHDGATVACPKLNGEPIDFIGNQLPLRQNFAAYHRHFADIYQSSFGA